jgi:putative ABC transport system permease protein
MNFWDSFKIALVAIRANTLRSILTALGIIIGVASVIVMVAVGQGARQAVDARIASLGTNLLIISPGSARLRGRRSGTGTSLPLTEQDVTAIRAHVPSVVGISGRISGTIPVINGNANWITTVQGINPDYIEVRAWTIARGRTIAAADERANRKVALLGATVIRELFGDDDPVGRTIRIRNVPFKVVGTLGVKGQSGYGRDQDDIVMIPLSTGRGHIVGRSAVQPYQVGSLHVKIADASLLGEAKDELERLLRERRRVRPGTEDNFYVRDLTEFIRARTATQTTLGLLLGATAAISLIVGGIGIMNIMLVSVTERTREIGLRMAVGARRRDILMQFLVEAVTLCLVGGAIGVGIGLAASIVIAMSAEWPISLNPFIVVLALGASAAVGIFFGFFPARRAAHLNPIDALRTE